MPTSTIAHCFGKKTFKQTQRFKWLIVMGSPSILIDAISAHGLQQTRYPEQFWNIVPRHIISDGLEDLTFHKRIIAATTVVVLPEKQLLNDGLSRSTYIWLLLELIERVKEMRAQFLYRGLHQHHRPIIRVASCFLYLFVYTTVFEGNNK